MKRKSLCVEGNIGADDILQMCLKTKKLAVTFVDMWRKTILCNVMLAQLLVLICNCFFFRVLHWQ